MRTWLKRNRFLCVPYLSSGFGVSGHETSKWLKRSICKSKSSRTNSSSSSNFLPAKKPLEGSLWDVSLGTQKPRKWSLLGHCFGQCSELPFTFEFLRCSFCVWVWYLWLLAHSFWMLLEASFRAGINLMAKCLQIQLSSKQKSCCCGQPLSFLGGTFNSIESSNEWLHSSLSRNFQSSLARPKGSAQGNHHRWKIAVINLRCTLATNTYMKKDDSWHP